MVDIGILSNIMKSPSLKCYMTFWGHDHIQWHPPLIRYFTKSWPCYRTGPYYRFFSLITLFREVSIGHLQRVRLANRGRLLFRTPGPVPFWTYICSNVETILSWCCHVYRPFEFRTPLGISILFMHANHSITNVLSPKCYVGFCKNGVEIKWFLWTCYFGLLRYIFIIFRWFCSPVSKKKYFLSLCK